MNEGRHDLLGRTTRGLPKAFNYACITILNTAPWERHLPSFPAGLMPGRRQRPDRGHQTAASHRARRMRRGRRRNIPKESSEFVELLSYSRSLEHVGMILKSKIYYVNMLSSHGNRFQNVYPTFQSLTTTLTWAWLKIVPNALDPTLQY